MAVGTRQALMCAGQEAADSLLARLLASALLINASADCLHKAGCTALKSLQSVSFSSTRQHQQARRSHTPQSLSRRGWLVLPAAM